MFGVSDFSPNFQLLPTEFLLSFKFQSVWDVTRGFCILSEDVRRAFAREQDLKKSRIRN